MLARPRPGSEARHRRRLRRRRAQGARPGAGRSARHRRGAGACHVAALLPDDEPGRARSDRSAPRGVRPHPRPRARLLRGDAHRRGDLAPHQRCDAASAGDRLRPVDVPAQRAHDGRSRRDAVRDELETRGAGAGGRAGDAASDSSARPARTQALAREQTGSPKSRPTSTRRCTRWHGAGGRARTPTRESGGRGGVPRGRGARAQEGLAHLVSDADRLQRGQGHHVDRRTRRSPGA